MSDNAPTAARVITPGITVAAFAALLWSVLRRDRLPDLLRIASRDVFECDGLSFAVVVVDLGRVCELRVYYQNRYENPCRARLVIRPARGFLLARPELETITLTIECPGAVFGVARMPYGVPNEIQGKKQSLDLAGEVEYPDGRGRMLRFLGGVRVGRPQLEAWKVAATVAGALGGQIVMWKPARLKVAMPAGVLEAVSDDAPIVYETLWRPGETGDRALAAMPRRESSRLAPAASSDRWS
jgi:hypothetical protein